MDAQTTRSADPGSDAALVGRARAGDHQAFAEIVRRYQGKALRVAWSICQSTQEAEDAVQEAFISAYRSLDRFRDGAALSPWLMRIVANSARNRRRSAGRWRRTQERHRVTESIISEPAELEALAGVTAAGLLDALGRLGQRDREVLGCRFMAGLNESETAEAIGCPAGTVKSRTARALGRLRVELAGMGIKGFE